MELSDEQLVVFLVLLVAVAAMLIIAPTLRVPYPIVLVIGGVAVGFLPGMPELELPPDLVLIAVLPPLLYAGTFFTSLHELKLNMRPIGLLSVGLVIMTTVVVAAVAHATIDGLSWSSAFVLGAIVSPTDPIAATAMARRFGVPRRLVSIVEGESLINDGTALVAYRFAVVAVVTGAFSIWEAGLEFLYSVSVGIAIGLGVGWLVRQLRRRLDNPPVEITIALLSAYIAAIPAELVHASAVLARSHGRRLRGRAYLGAHHRAHARPERRRVGHRRLPLERAALRADRPTAAGDPRRALGEPAGTLLFYGLVVSATVIVVRIVGTYAVTYLPRFLSRRIRERDPYPPWQHPAFVAWSGMRGAVTLAAALALPLTTDAGEAFPARDLIQFLAFCVIVATLVGQGLSMPLVIRFLGLERDHHAETEEARARIHAAEAALARLEELIDEDWVPAETAERLRGLYAFRHGRYTARHTEEESSHEEQQEAYQRLRRELIAAEREVLHQLRREGVITEQVAQRVVYDIDLEDIRLDP